MKKIISLPSKRVWWLLALALVVVIGGVVVAARNGEDNANLLILEPATLEQSVTLSGQVKPAGKADLAFDRAGRVGAVLAQVGDRVELGAVLVRLASGALSAELERAQADLATEQARLAELERGARAEDLAVSRAEVARQEDDFLDSQKNMVYVLQDTFVRADNALRYEADPLFISPRSSLARFAFNTSNTSRAERVADWRSDFEYKMADWRKQLLALGAGSDLSVYYSQAKAILLEMQVGFDDLAYLVNLVPSGDTANGITGSEARTKISAARAAISAALDGLESGWRDYNSSWNTLEVAKRELSLDLAGASAEEVSAQAARVRAASASVSAARAALSESVLVAPFPALVTYQEARVGEVATAGVVLVKLSAIDPFIIEANVPEVDIVKVKTGDIAAVTLDAYGPTVEFQATVGQIDPAETVLDGVPTYKITLHFTALDERIRSGMTANISLATGLREGVLAVPLRAVSTSSGRSTVRVKKGEEIFEQEVVLGLVSSDGQVEILSGLQSGDKVVTP